MDDLQENRLRKIEADLDSLARAAANNLRTMSEQFQSIEDRIGHVYGLLDELGETIDKVAKR